MARFKHTDNSQGLFISVNLKEQLLPDTPEWAIDYLVDKMDLSLFEQNYHNDKKGAAAYSPRILLKVIFYCYSKGIITFRKIEKACRDNIIMKALAGDSEPDHDTIAAFISGNGEAATGLFTQVLLQCARLELITGQMFAIDGCKLPSNASKEWPGSIAGLRKKRGKPAAYIKRIVIRHREPDNDEKARKIQAPYKKAMGSGKERRERSVERLCRYNNKTDTYVCPAGKVLEYKYDVALRNNTVPKEGFV